MSRNKSLLVVLTLAAIVSLGSQLQAQTVEVTIAGSSAQWQTQALGAFGGLESGSTVKGHCGKYLISGNAAKAPCFHYTANSGFSLYDTRPSTANVDGGAIWIVWDSSASPKVWAFIKVDSGVGVRCYFANPACSVEASSIPAAGNVISSALWGTDTTLPTAIGSLFTASPYITVNVAATDIRPEDALWATCRANSQAGVGSSNFDPTYQTDGLGYNANFGAGDCPAVSGIPWGNAGQGSAIKSGYASSTSTANVLAFAVTGNDPITGNPVPSYSTVSVGAAPIVFVFSRNGTNGPGGGSPFASLTNVSTTQVDQLFSGQNCDASVFGFPSAAIAAYLREPLSGTMNTTESTVFRFPVGGTPGASQEYNAKNPGNSLPNPLAGGNCAKGAGGRWRGIGTGEVVKSVLNSVANNSIDGMTYSFFSYGNISSLANKTAYGYASLDGVDGIFYSYNSTNGGGFDPGQPPNGELPGSGYFPSTCSSGFPCPEYDIWALQGLSFPNVRSGAYRAWSLLRSVSTGAALTAEQNLVKSSQLYVVSTTPDYIPVTKVSITSPKKFTDPGLTLVRSHYQQYDGGKNNLGPAPVNTGASEAGGDMGGCIILSTNTATQLIQQGVAGTACATRP